MLYKYLCLLGSRVLISNTGKISTLTRKIQGILVVISVGTLKTATAWVNNSPRYPGKHGIFSRRWLNVDAGQHLLLAVECDWSCCWHCMYYDMFCSGRRRTAPPRLRGPCPNCKERSTDWKVGEWNGRHHAGLKPAPCSTHSHTRPSHHTLTLFLHGDCLLRRSAFLAVIAIYSNRKLWTKYNKYIVNLSARDPSLDFRIWRLYTSDSDV